MSWEVFDKTTRKGPKPIIGSFNGASGRLFIGALLRRAGFDVGARYDLLFDRTNRLIGLKVADVGGYRVTQQGPPFVMNLRAFCGYYHLRDVNCRFESFEYDEGVWCLALNEKAQDIGEQSPAQQSTDISAEFIQ